MKPLASQERYVDITVKLPRSRLSRHDSGSNTLSDCDRARRGENLKPRGEAVGADKKPHLRAHHGIVHNLVLTAIALFFQWFCITLSCRPILSANILRDLQLPSTSGFNSSTGVHVLIAPTPLFSLLYHIYSSNGGPRSAYLHQLDRLLPQPKHVHRLQIRRTLR